MEPVKVDLEAYRGDSWEQAFNFKRDGIPYNLTGATVACWAAFDGTHFVMTTTVIDAANGKIKIALPPTAKAGKYQYDIEVIEAAGAVNTWVRGTLDVIQDITNAA